MKAHIIRIKHIKKLNSNIPMKNQKKGSQTVENNIKTVIKVI